MPLPRWAGVSGTVACRHLTVRSFVCLSGSATDPEGLDPNYPLLSRRGVPVHPPSTPKSRLSTSQPSSPWSVRVDEGLRHAES